MLKKHYETHDIDLSLNSQFKKIELRNAYYKDWMNLSGKERE